MQHVGSSLRHVGSFVVVCRLLVAACGLLSSYGTEHVGSVAVVHRLSRPVACGTLVPQSGIKPMSPALEGRFLTTGPPGKSLFLFLLFCSCFALEMLPFYLSGIYFLEAKNMLEKYPIMDRYLGCGMGKFIPVSLPSNTTSKKAIKTCF